MLEQLTAYLPRLLAAIAALLAGWLLASLSRKASARLADWLASAWDGLVTRLGLDRPRIESPPVRLVGEVVFWIVILFSIATASELLGLHVFTSWFSDLTGYIPILISGAFILVAGIIFSFISRDLVFSAASAAGLVQADFFARASQLVVLVTAVVIGADQIGIDVTFLSIMLGVLSAAVFGGLAMAFGMGARAHVANVIAGHQIQKHCKAGDTVRVRDLEGKIVEITTTRVVLDTGEGRLIVPANIFDEEISVVVREPGQDEAE